MAAEFAAREHVATVGDGDSAIEILLSRTRNGTRVRIEAEGADAAIELDAIGLESLTWQDRGAFRNDIGSEPPEREKDILTDWTDRIPVGNEYTHVDLLLSPDAEQVKLESRRLGYEIALDASQLATIAALDMDAISAFLRTPFGPDL